MVGLFASLELLVCSAFGVDILVGGTNEDLWPGFGDFSESASEIVWYYQILLVIATFTNKLFSGSS